MAAHWPSAIEGEHQITKGLHLWSMSFLPQLFGTFSLEASTDKSGAGITTMRASTNTFSVIEFRSICWSVWIGYFYRNDRILLDVTLFLVTHHECSILILSRSNTEGRLVCVFIRLLVPNTNKWMMALVDFVVFLPTSASFSSFFIFQDLAQTVSPHLFRVYTFPLLSSPFPPLPFLPGFTRFSNPWGWPP